MSHAVANRAIDRHDENAGAFGAADVTPYYDADAAAGPAAYVDRGEEAALLYAAPHVRGGRLLDVGVGGGRTTSLLLLLSDDYTGVDYAPEMVEIARRRHPQQSHAVADARHLDAVADASKDLVLFSFNGIDSVNHDDRALVLREFARVVSDDGLVVFSTLNKEGTSYAESPLQLRRPRDHGVVSRSAVRTFAGRVARPGRMLGAVRRWRSPLGSPDDHGTWAECALSAHDFRVRAHFTTLPELRRSLSEAHLEIVRLFDGDGRDITQVAESTTDWFTVVARRSRS